MRSFNYQSNKAIKSEAKELLDKIIAGNLEGVKKLINVENINKSIEPDTGLTPIHVAIDHEKLDIIKYLLEQRADVEICYLNVDNTLSTALWSYKKYKTDLGKKIALFLIARGVNTKSKEVLQYIAGLDNSDPIRILIEKINILKDTKNPEDKFKLELEILKNIESSGEKEYASLYITTIINDFAKNKKYKEASEWFQKYLAEFKDDKQKEAIIDSLEILKDHTLIDNSQNTSLQIESKSVESKQQYPSLASNSEITDEKAQIAFTICMGIANSYMAQIDTKYSNKSQNENKNENEKDNISFEKAKNYYLKAYNILQKAKLNVDMATETFLKAMNSYYVGKINLLIPRPMIMEHLLFAEAAKLGSVEAKNFLLYDARSSKAAYYVLSDIPNLDIPLYLVQKYNGPVSAKITEAAKALYGIGRKRNVFEAAQTLKAVEIKSPNANSIILLTLQSEAYSQIALTSADENIIKLNIDRCLSCYNEMIDIIKKNIDQKTGKLSNEGIYFNTNYSAPLFQLLSVAKDSEFRDRIYQQIQKFIELTADVTKAFSQFKIIFETLIETKLLEENPDRLKDLVKLLQELIAKNPTEKLLLDSLTNLKAIADRTQNPDIRFYVNKAIADSFYQLTFTEQKAEMAGFYTSKARLFYEFALDVLPTCKNVSPISVASLHKIYAKLSMKVEPAQALTSYQKSAELDDLTSALEGAKLAAQDEKTIDKAVSLYQTAVKIALKESNEADIKSVTEAIQNFTKLMDLSMLPHVNTAVSEMLTLLQKRGGEKPEAKNSSPVKEVILTGLYPNLNPARSKPVNSSALYPQLETKQAVIKIDPAILARKSVHLANVAKEKELKDKKLKIHIETCARDNDLSAVDYLFKYYTDKNPKEISEILYRKFNGPHVRRPLYLATKSILLSLNKKNTQSIYDISPSELDKNIAECKKYLSDWGKKKYSTLSKGTDAYEYCLFARWLQKAVHNTIEGIDCDDPDLFLMRLLDSEPEQIELGDKHIIASKKDIRRHLVTAMKEGVGAKKEWITEKEKLAETINKIDEVNDPNLKAVNSTRATITAKLDAQKLKKAETAPLYPPLVVAASAPHADNASMSIIANLSNPFVLPIEQTLIYDEHKSALPESTVGLYPKLNEHTVGTQTTFMAQAVSSSLPLLHQAADAKVSSSESKMYPSLDVSSVPNATIVNDSVVISVNSDPESKMYPHLDVPPASNAAIVNDSVAISVNAEMEPGATITAPEQNSRTLDLFGSHLAFFSSKEVAKQPVADSKQESINHSDTQDISGLDLYSLFQTKPTVVADQQDQPISKVEVDKHEAKAGEKKPLLSSKKKEKVVVMA